MNLRNFSETPPSRIHAYATEYGDMHGRRLGAEFGGTDIIFCTTKFPNDLFGKNSILTPSWLSFACLYCLKSHNRPISHIYRRLYNLFLDEKPHFGKKFSHFLSTSCFSAHSITLLLQILGGRINRPSPSSNFWRTVATQSP